MSAVDEQQEHEVRFGCTECPWTVTASKHDASIVDVVQEHEDSHQHVGQPRSAERTYMSGEHPAMMRGRSEFRRLATGSLLFGLIVAAGWVFLLGKIARWW